ncbi:hypothetical protein AMTRI_Chr08g162930 [Amborella trichopoda]
MDTLSSCIETAPKDFEFNLDLSRLACDLTSLHMGQKLDAESIGESAELEHHEEYNIVTGNSNLLTEELRFPLDKGLVNQDLEGLGLDCNGFQEPTELSQLDNEIMHHDKTKHLDGTTNEVGQVPQTEAGQIVESTSMIRKGLNKCATFPCSQMLLLSPIQVNKKDGMQGPSHPGETSLSYSARSSSLPTDFKLVSAMKGGREQQGISPKPKLAVKWAPDVYEPTPTSLSHTVRNHQRAKPKKKDHNKNKHGKGKSSRGSGSDKKQHYHRRSTGYNEFRCIRLQAPIPFGERVIENLDFPRKLVELTEIRDVQERREDPLETNEVADFAVSSQDSKCGSSFLRQVFGKVHLPFAEAT